jgi:hypothetical protein
MDAKWFSLQSMKLNHSIIGAINTVCIHLKLMKANDQPLKSEDEIKEAIRTIKIWLTELDKFLIAYEQNTFQAITGVNPRIQQFIKRFSSAKRKNEFRSKIFHDRPVELTLLLSEDDPKYSDDLINSLADLRTLLEEHNQSDFKNLLPDL